MSYVAYNTPYKNNDPMQGPAWCRRFDDFEKVYALTSNLPVTATSPYNAKATASGTFSQATPTIGNGNAVLSGAATTTESGVQLQRDQANVLLGLGVTALLTVQVQLSDATNTDFIFGFGTNAGASTAILNGTESAVLLSNLATATYVDFVGLYKPFAQTVFYPVQAKTSGTPTSGHACGAATTNQTILGIQIVMDPVTAAKGVVSFYQDDVLLESFTSLALPALNLSEFVGMLSATATGTISLNLGWIDATTSR